MKMVLTNLHRGIVIEGIFFIGKVEDLRILRRQEKGANMRGGDAEVLVPFHLYREGHLYIYLSATIPDSSGLVMYHCDIS